MSIYRKGFLLNRVNQQNSTQNTDFLTEQYTIHIVSGIRCTSCSICVCLIQLFKFFIFKAYFLEGADLRTILQQYHIFIICCCISTILSLILNLTLGKLTLNLIHLRNYFFTLFNSLLSFIDQWYSLLTTILSKNLILMYCREKYSWRLNLCLHVIIIQFDQKWKVLGQHLILKEHILFTSYQCLGSGTGNF